MINKQVNIMLSFQDQVIIELTQTGLGKRSREEETLTKEDDPILVVHPNYVIDQ